MTIELLKQIIKEKIDKLENPADPYDGRLCDNSKIIVLQEILAEYEKRKSPCKCTKWQAPTDGIQSYYTCKNCGHNFRYHVADTYRCEGEENKK